MSFWQTPEAIAKVAEANVKVLLVVDGIALWDLVSSIKFDIQMLRTDKRTKWSFWVYIAIRVLLLANIGANIAGFNTPVEINCQVWAILLHLTILGALALSQLLVLLRLLALWEGHLIMKSIPCFIWLAQVAIYIYIISNIRAVWLPAPQNACFVEDTNRNIIYISFTFVVDAMLSVITVISAYRHRMLPLGRLILKHGIAWVVLATLSEVPPLVLLVLNLNAPWNIILQTPAGFTMIIACTHMYRTLIKFGNSPPTQFSDPPSYLGAGGRRAPGSRSGQHSGSGALNISQPHPIELRPMFDGDGALTDMKTRVDLDGAKAGSRIV